jgi:PAS domain S-box-containing protein
MKISTKLTVGLLSIIVLMWIGVVFSVKLYLAMQEEHEKVENDIIPEVIEMFEFEHTMEKLREWTFIYILRDNVIMEGKTVKEWLENTRSDLDRIATKHVDLGLKVSIKELIVANQEILNQKELGVETEELLRKLDEEVCCPLFLPALTVIREHKAFHIEELFLEEEMISRTHTASVYLLLLMSSIITVISIIVIAITRKAILTPLHALQEGAKVIGTGKLDYRVGTEANDEIGQLSRAFDRMTSALSKTVVSKNYVENILMSMSDTLIVLSEDLLIQKVNLSLQKLLGYKEDELIGSSIDLIIKRNILAGSCVNELCFEQREEIYLSKESKEIPVFFSYSRLLNEDNECEGYICVAQDRTKRKEMEEELKESEQRYSLLFKSMTSGFAYSKIILDEEQNLIDFELLETNKIFEDITGLKKEDIVGRKASQILQMLSVNEKFWMNTFKDVVLASRVKKLEKFSVVLDKWLSILIYSPQKGQFAVLLDDISERKSAEVMLKQSNDEKAALLTSIPAYVFFKDKDAKYIYANRQLLDLIDLELEELKGKTDFDIFPNDLAETYNLIDQQVMEMDKSIVTDGERVQTADGDIKWTYTTKVPFHDENGKVIGVVGTAFDITDLKRVEAELIEAKKIAEDANLEKTRFLSNMSHEIRTPMNGIIGMANLISKMDLNKKQEEYISILKESSNALLEIINDILDVSKIEAGKIEVENRSFNIRELLVSVLQSFYFRAEEKHVDMIYNINSDVPEILKGDFIRLKQILRNLLSNALKFTEAGQIELNTNIKKIDLEHVSLQISVKDTGIGICSNKIERIFESFTQSDISITRKYGGTGLGLTITKSLIHLMGGNISVESVEDEGTVFEVIIPFEIIKENEFKIMKEEQLEVIQRSNYTKKLDLKILIAEDNRINQIYISELLKIYVNEFVIVNNGKKVLEKLDMEFFDCILMDIQMPIMDGASATKEIRKRELESGSHIPIIALTASALTSEMKNYMRAGMDDYLTKPLNEEKLLLLLDKIEKNKHQNEIIELKKEEGYYHHKAIDQEEFLNTYKKFDNQIIIEMIDCFLKDYRERVKVIENDIRLLDYNSLKFNMHTFKGIFANFRATKLAELSSCLENKAVKKDEYELHDLLHEIKKNIKIFVEELQVMKVALSEN